MLTTTARRLSLVLGVLGCSSLSTWAQPPTSTAVRPATATGLQAVPKHRPRIATRRDEPADPRHDGWNLKWRKSSQVSRASETAGQGSSVPDDSSVPNGSSVPSGSSVPNEASRSRSHRPAAQPVAESTSEPSSLRELLSRHHPTHDPQQPTRHSRPRSEVRQVTWLADPQQDRALDLPNDLQSAPANEGGGETDFFNDPFSDAAPRDESLTQRPGAPSAETPLPAPAPSEPVEVLELPAPEPDPPAEQHSLGQSQQPAELSAPTESTQTLPAPEPNSSAGQRSSLGDMFRQNRPEESGSTLSRPANSRPTHSPSSPSQPPVSPEPTPAQPAPAEVASPQPPSAAEPRPTSPSDLQPFGTNPFDRSRRRDDQREGAETAPRREDRAGTSEGRDEPVRGETGISCEQFRDRIAGQTIRQVSLDISPPFRPDVIEQAQYEELKADFDEAQQIRQWRSVEGRLLDEGRLVDLAYEKVVIETEQGSLERLPMNQLSEGDLAYISNNWGLPTECLIAQVDHAPRRWTPTTMTWAASNLCHHPLYFEQVNLERYGHTAGPFLQPVVSSAHFFANIAVLPYKTGVHSPHECQYALGYYRPGNCAPWIVPPVPLSLEGALRQAASMTGSYLLVP